MAERMTAATAIIKGDVEAAPQVEGANITTDRLKTGDCQWSLVLPDTRGEVLVTCDSPSTFHIGKEILENRTRVNIVMGDGGEGSKNRIISNYIRATRLVNFKNPTPHQPI